MPQCKFQMAPCFSSIPPDAAWSLLDCGWFDDIFTHKTGGTSNHVRPHGLYVQNKERKEWGLGIKYCYGLIGRLMDMQL
jgi:hypothetical protein